MLKLEFTEEEINHEDEATIDYSGLYDIPMNEYQNADALSNSDLQIFKANHSSYIWNKEAPTDPLKVSSNDFGTALHTSLLEPELFEESVKVSSVKGRATDAFIRMQTDFPDKIILTEIEYNQIKIMTESAKCDPMFNRVLGAEGTCESSIFVIDPRTGLKLKIRPDKIINNGKMLPLFNDVKSSADIDEWRNDRQWINPLFKFGYGFTACFYLYVGSIYYGEELTRYNFNVVSKSSTLGKYPVSVFTISKEELIELGFWAEMISALDEFAKCKESGNFTSYERFPAFNIFTDETIEFKE